MLGTLRLSQPTLFEFYVRWVMLCQGFIHSSVTCIVTVGWIKPLAAYPAKTRTGWKAPKDVIDFKTLK